jgi:hypothetical protein
MDYKKIFGKFEGQNIFIKTTQKRDMDSAQKAALNRKGNELFKSGDVEGAKRIFLTTGFSDGLSRIGDAYKKQKRYMDALYMYKIAPNPRKLEAMARQMADIIKDLIKDKEP